MKEKKLKFSTVSLPAPLIEKVKRKIRGKGFHSPSAYIAFILREILAEDSKEGFSKETEAKVKERLKSLGYL